MLEKQDEILYPEAVLYREASLNRDYLGGLVTPLGYKYIQELLQSHKAQSRWIELQDISGKELIAENKKLKDALEHICEVEMDSAEFEKEVMFNIARDVLREVKP